MTTEAGYWRHLAIELRAALHEERQTTLRVYGYGIMTGALIVWAAARFLS